ncbi:hypothetical protein Dimus_030477, partial [Dionaea muscipula]
CHRRSPSPMLLSSPNPAEVCSSEVGEATVVVVTMSEDEDDADLEDGRMFTPQFFKPNSFPEESDRYEGLTMAASSGSSTISPTTAVLLCQNAIDAGGPADGRLMLARADSVSSVSSPSVGDCPLVSDGARQMVVDGNGGPGCLDLVLDSVRLHCSSPQTHRAPSVCGPLVVGEGMESTVAECGDAQNLVQVGEALISSVDADTVQRTGCDTVSISSASLSSFVDANDGGEVEKDVQPMLNPRQCDQKHHKLIGSNLLRAVGTVCDSSFPSLGGSVGRVGDGLVSEEGRVSPVAREALRS